ncbi:LysM peptidoglycan-binding domain-containing protein [Arthrobacter sp. C152]
METHKPNRGDIGTALALLTLGVVLCLLGRGLLGQWEASAGLQQEPSLDSLLGLAAAAAGTALLLWWITSLISAAAGVLLERGGQRRAAAAARRFSPVFMQRLAIAALSLQLASGAAAQAAVSAPRPQWAPTAAQSSAAPSDPAGAPALPHTQDESWEETLSVAGPDPVSGAASVESAVDAGAALPGATLDLRWQPVALPVEPGPLAGAQTRPASEVGAGGGKDAVTVLAGDTLWDIVAAHLGPGASDVQIALEWPRWYAANRALIGPSPDVLLPGQILLAPAPA